jgi:beta-barrel assembly-enhancing protease
MEATSLIYSCHGFHDALPGGKASGELHFDGFGLTYRVGPLTGTLPFSQLKFTLGGAANRLIFITHPSMVELTLYTSDLTILKNPLLLAHPDCAPQLLNARQERQKHWAVFLSVGLAILALPVVLLWNMTHLSKYASEQIPVEWETKLGQSAAAQYRITNRLMDDKKVDAHLQPLVAPLLAALENSPYQYQFTIVNDGTLNAFALPGGFVTIHSGLILRAESAEELLGVVAHEISHVEERHGLRSIIGNVGIYVIASAIFGDVSGIMASISSAAPMLVSQQYSRAFETAADEQAAELMLRAQVDPEGLPRFFEKMIAEEKAMLAKIENRETQAAVKTALTFLSSHPASEERMAHLRELTAGKGGDYIDLTQEFTALKDVVKQFVEISKEESSVDQSTQNATESEDSASTQSNEDIGNE